MPKPRNAILKAYEDLDEEEEVLDDEPSEEEEEEAFDPEEAGEYTDEDVEEEVQQMEESRRRQVENSRRAGRAPARGQRKGRQTAVKREARARTPQRERAIDWKPANTLDAPPARAGMEQRWIRFQLGDKNDPKNWSRKVRERWAVRKLDTVPEDYTPPTEMHGTLGEVIAVGDLILCERPLEIGQSRRKYFRAKHQRQMAAADRRHVNKVERDDHPIKVTSRRDRPTVGVGRRRPAVQDD